MSPTYTTYETTSTTDAGLAVLFAMFALFVLVSLVVAVLMTVSLWRLFTKAGKPGWAAIVPVYNEIVALQIAGRPVWWVLIIMFVPLFGLWVGIVAAIDFMRSYGKSLGFTIFGILVPFIALPMMAFGKSTQYVRPVAEGFDDFVPAPEASAAQAATTQFVPQPPASFDPAQAPSAVPVAQVAPEPSAPVVPPTPPLPPQQ